MSLSLSGTQVKDLVVADSISNGAQCSPEAALVEEKYEMGELLGNWTEVKRVGYSGAVEEAIFAVAWDDV